ncbi:hypothetical protein [Candidatus Enterovibrio escicola]|uniref:hypothetical protein n=1 Tax=Candidatus Enterovibrio escicola TaxID=1927127 RepID=UPI001237FDD2|nr:hypothetical protein [Candidatus Enterovibrio escacola]
MTLIKLIQVQTKKGWNHKYQRSESPIYTVEVLHNESSVVEICFRRSTTLNGRKCPDRFLSAYVADGLNEFEIKTLVELEKWFNNQ